AETAPATETVTETATPQAPAVTEAAPDTPESATAPTPADSEVAADPAEVVPVSVPSSSDVQEAVDNAIATVGTPSADPTNAATPPISKVTSGAVFLLGLGLLTVFLLYVAAESTRRKRIFGSFLTVAVAVISVWLFGNLGME